MMKLRLALLNAAASIGILMVAAPVSAQDANVEGRVKKLEKEMQAVQRQVFPNGAGKFFEPEIKQETANDPSNVRAPSSSAVSDLIVRVDALEAQLANLTGQVEQQGNRMRQMEDRLKAMEASLKKQQAEIAAASQAENTTVPAAVAPTPIKPNTTGSANSARVKAVAAIEKPVTGDAFEDSYNYGYRLWDAKFYPEAQVQLEDTVKKFPKHPRASFARNLLGRAWLDDKRPASAVKIFYDNYKEAPRGERAPDSLYFLGVALNELGKRTEACQAFDELESAYTAEATGRLANRLASGRASAKCK